MNFPMNAPGMQMDWPAKRTRITAAKTALLLLLCLVLLGPAGAFAAVLEVQISPRLNGAPVQLDALTSTNAAGQTLSISRLDFLLSDFAVRTPDGLWVAQTNWQAYLSVAAKRLNFTVPGLPDGPVDRIRFHVGLRPDLNHTNPAQYAADHPLNPNLNGLHWGWANGYVFFAIEGRWLTTNTAAGVTNAAQNTSGYSFHLGNDPMLMTVELPVTMELRGRQAWPLTLDLDRVLGSAKPWRLSPETASTHSRPGDELALQLKDAVAAAFSPSASEAPAFAAPPALPAPRVLMATNATLYRFSFSRQFPPPPLPRDNPLTEEGVALGRALFNDPQLSINGKQSCATCHQIGAAFVDKGKALSLGAEGQMGTRNTMPLFNLAWKQSFFWDGRARALREQALMPIQNPIEMHESLEHVVAKLQTPRPAKAPDSTPDYRQLFTRAFGSDTIDADRMARALEQFLLTLTSFDSKFDRALAGEATLSDEEKRGFQLFMTEYDPGHEQFGADCFHCHGGPFFSNHSFANNGLDVKFCDPGLGEFTKREFDQGRFAVPTLRNVELTGPYMHDGRFTTLEEVIDHYNTGVQRSPSLDPNLAKHPTAGMQLSDADKKALVAFLKTLTDERYRGAEAQGAKSSKLQGSSQ